MSDNTNLALFLWNEGIVSFYGGQLLNQVATPGHLHNYTKRYLRRAFFDEQFGTLEPSDEWADLTVGWHRDDYAEVDPQYQDATGWIWAGSDGTVTGRVWGGCLAILEWQLMTGRYLPEPDRLDGAVLVLETAEDMPSANRVKWTLMSMGERGLLERFDAMLVGRPATENWQEERSLTERQEYRSAQRDAIRKQVARYNPDAPLVFDLDFGHTNPTAPIPIGSRVRIEPMERIEFL